MKKSIIAVALLASMNAQAEWNFESKVDAFTDSAKHSASSIDQTGGETSITMGRCSDGDMSAVYSAIKFIGGDTAKVMYRIDSEPAVTEYWTVASNNTAVFVKNSETFLKSLQSGSKLTIRVYNYQNVAIDRTVDLTGSSSAIDQLFAACNS